MCVAKVGGALETLVRLNAVDGGCFMRVLDQSEFVFLAGLDSDFGLGHFRVFSAWR